MELSALAVFPLPMFPLGFSCFAHLISALEVQVLYVVVNSLIPYRRKRSDQKASYARNHAAPRIHHRIHSRGYRV